MADALRTRPFVWPSWVKRLLSGEDRCWWKAWYKSHYNYEKLPEETNFDEWNKKHDAIVQKRAAEFRAEGWDVKVEDEGSFRLLGVYGDLSGKPDVVATKNEVAVVSDAKSGKPRESDHWQVLLYMFALPLDWLRAEEVHGEVEYSGDRRVHVRALGPVERHAIMDTLQKVTGPEPLLATPSPFECKYCDVAACKSRYVQSTGDAKKYF